MTNDQNIMPDYFYEKNVLSLYNVRKNQFIVRIIIKHIEN